MATPTVSIFHYVSRYTHTDVAVTAFKKSIRACVGLALSLCVLSCSEKAPVDPCCQISDLPPNSGAADGQGYLLVEGSTNAYFYVLNESGEEVNYQSLNKGLALDEGRYRVRVNNAAHPVEIVAGEMLKCSTGTLMVSGNTNEYYYVMDSTGQQLGYESLSKSMSYFPGAFTVKVNDTQVSAEVRLKQLTEIRTGTILVKGTTNEYYYVLDKGNKQLNYNSLEKPLAFLPGTYSVKVNNTSMEAEVLAGQITELLTGSLLVHGLTAEYYYVTDTVGNALNYQSLNKPLAFFPGNVLIKVNNTVARGMITPGQVAEFATGSLMLTGGGTGYYYVIDNSGTQLNYNSLNKSLSFFPSEYTVKLGSSSRKAVVTAGQLTSISAFK